MKLFFRNIHLYLSLLAGIVIASCCFTGAALVFEKEMMHSIYPERYQVTIAGQRTSLDQLISKLQDSKPLAQVSGVKVYQDLARTVEINFIEEEQHTAGQKANSAPEGSKPQVAFMNPYSGELIAISGQKSPFFRTMFEWHRWLLVKEPGKIIVGVSTTFFLFIILTGLILWWPKTKKVLKQRLTLKWQAGWKRLNHDLHLVLGFYTGIFLFVFAFTGLAWSFEWFNNGIYVVTGSDKEPPSAPLSKVQAGKAPITFEQAYVVAKANFYQAEFYNLHKPKEDSAAFTIQVMPANAIHDRASGQLFLDQYSGELLGQLMFEEKNLGQRVRGTFYPVHTGSIGGMPTKILAFICCVAGFTFPFTGLILWLNRLKKERKALKKTGKKKQTEMILEKA